MLTVLQVKVLKDKIEKEKGEGYKAGEQKLIYAGKILGESKEGFAPVWPLILLDFRNVST